MKLKILSLILISIGLLFVVKKVSEIMILGLKKDTIHPSKLNSIKQNIYFLGSDQTDNKIRLFSGRTNEKEELNLNSIWEFLPKDKPTDAKRVDEGEKVSVIIAAHGSIYKVPVNYKDKYTFADTHQSCHSVEILPDGNMISASSDHNKLTLHFNKVEEVDRFKFTESFDIFFEQAHGVVYDKERDLIWVSGGSTLGKFKYECCPNPELVFQAEYPLVLSHSNGHDLFPDGNGGLLLTTQQGILNYTFNKNDNIFPCDLVYSDKSIKSVVADIYNGDIYITSPDNIPGYFSYQTDKIINITKSKEYVRPGSKFYKVRLWQKNNFSY